MGRNKIIVTVFSVPKLTVNISYMAMDIICGILLFNPIDRLKLKMITAKKHEWYSANAMHKIIEAQLHKNNWKTISYHITIFQIQTKTLFETCLFYCLKCTKITKSWSCTNHDIVHRADNTEINNNGIKLATGFDHSRGAVFDQSAVESDGWRTWE